MPAYCPKCGAAVFGKPFCANCGSALEPRPRADPVSVFYSYSHKDEDLRNELEGASGGSEASGLIQEWHDRKILPGQDWDREIDKYLQSASLILFLISADFINSSYISDVEVKQALDRQRAGVAVVIPIILRPVLWNVIPELGRLQALPDGARPITEWPSHDAAFLSVPWPSPSSRCCTPSTGTSRTTERLARIDTQNRFCGASPSRGKRTRIRNHRRRRCQQARPA